MTLATGTRVAIEAKSVGRAARTGVVEEVLRGDPRPRYRIRWDDGHVSSYTPAAGELRAIQPSTAGRRRRSPTTARRAAGRKSK